MGWLHSRDELLAAEGSEYFNVPRVITSLILMSRALKKVINGNVLANCTLGHYPCKFMLSLQLWYYGHQNVSHLVT